MIRAVIIEDEERGVKVIERLINKFFSDKIEVVGKSDGVDSGIALIESLKPDLIFLDIELIDGSSFSILQHFDDPWFRVIFTTAFDHYAVKAFKFSAIDYLLKPINDEEFFQAVQRYMQMNIINTPEQFQNAALFYQEPKEQNHKLAIRSNNGICFENLSDIQALTAEKNYTDIHCLNKKKYTTSKNLGFYEELLLTNNNFIRIHHSTIVNLDHIRELRQSKNSHSAEVLLAEGLEFTVSARRLAELKSRLAS
ncbi:MAG: LytR/AlgR family response regulator transcription factor [Chitinophagales bacterium]|jgi:two-component system LytT family response regulator|nr:LytTR family DNA-binding domain-containing protein [Sphingobacteriales bacterium]